MAELSITRLENRVSVVGAPFTMAERTQLADLAAAAIAHAVGTPADVVIVDVTRATYFDARTLFTLHGIARRCVDLGLALVLEGASEELQEQLELTGLDEILGAYGTELRAPDNSDSTGAVA